MGREGGEKGREENTSTWGRCDCFDFFKSRSREGSLPQPLGESRRTRHLNASPYYNPLTLTLILTLTLTLTPLPYG